MREDMKGVSLKIRNKKGDTRGLHPKSLANLAKGQFPKGSNGDRSHSGYTLTSALKDSLHKPLRRPDLDAPVRDHIIYATLKGAIACEPTSAHLKEVWDRSEGKVPGDQPPVSNINVVFVIGKGYQGLPQLVEGKEGGKNG